MMVNVIAILVLLSSWVFSGPMILEFDTRLGDSTSLEIALPLYDSVDVVVDWGDGDSSVVKTEGVLKHTYATGGIKIVNVSGKLTRFGYAGSYTSKAEYMNKLTKVTSFGDLGLKTLYCTFLHATNLSEVPSVLPNTVWSLSYAFSKSGQEIIKNLNLWDVSQVRDMTGVFASAKQFNHDISSWDVSSAQTMRSMFHEASAFNQDVGSWDVSSVANMSNMFELAWKFNQDIGSWDVSSVTEMRSMFKYTGSFNQNISSWDVSQVNYMSWMFYNAGPFNQSINSWDVSNVIDMNRMFFGTDSFDQNIDSWDVSSVRNMSGMFKWTTSFNQSLDSWDVGLVDDMSNMFEKAKSFNQYIGSWDVSSVEDMGNMFEKAESFNQNIGNWNVKLVKDMRSMFVDASSFSSANYDSLLIGWSKLDRQQNVSFSAGTTKYSQGHPASSRDSIINKFNWTITDGGMSDMIVRLLDKSTTLKNLSDLNSLEGKATLYNLQGEVLWQGTLPSQLNQAKQVLENNQGLSLLKTPQGVYKF
jgi:trimeric autotransporter adhesin